MLDAGADVDAKAGEEDLTPLHVAAAYGQVPAIMALLDAGANVNAKMKNGETPLDLARWRMEETEGSLRHRHRHAIEILKAHGAR